MDYNADIPFEKPAAPGFYDTTDEININEREREAFDPRKQQLANKRKGDQEEDPERKRRKNEKSGPSAAYAAAAKAGQLQRIREAEQSSKRRSLVLPAPQVGESELEDIVKMGMVGEQATRLAGQGDNEATKGLINNYGGIVGGTPIRTPRAPPQEDHIANEIRNIRALTEAQSSLLGGENTPLHEGAGSTGFEGATPRRNVVATPNPMATPIRQGGPNGVGATPLNGAAPGATPIRTPRDNFAINQEYGSLPPGSTPREIRQWEQGQRSQIKSQFASLPNPKETDWELELPEEQQEAMEGIELSEEDAAERDRRNAAIKRAAEEAELKRRTQVLQKTLPRPSDINVNSLTKIANSIEDTIERAIALETIFLIANDAVKYPQPGITVTGKAKPIDHIDDSLLNKARLEILSEIPTEIVESNKQAFETAWAAAHEHSKIPGLAHYDSDDEETERSTLTTAFSVSSFSLSPTPFSFTNFFRNCRHHSSPPPKKATA